MAPKPGQVYPVIWKPLRQALEKLMADNDWHGYGELMANYCSLVPPETGYRAMPNRMRKTTTLERTIYLGRTKTVKETLRLMGCESRGRLRDREWRLAPRLVTTV